MAKRKIITIDEAQCNGCGLCIPNCPEGAIRIIDGKARLVSDLFCDGLGACLGHCPQGAISIEEREAEKYDERKVMENIVKQGNNVIKAHLDHLREHNEHAYVKTAVEYLQEKNIDIKTTEGGSRMDHHGGGCPGMRMVDSRNEGRKDGSGGEPAQAGSELRQWPVQLHLLNPHAPYFQNADLLIAADCVAFSFGNFHQRFLKGKTLVILCPKLDQGIEDYIEKLAEIFSSNDIKSITIAHMEVPCCFGTVQVVEEALKKSGKNIVVKDYTVSLKGDIV
ncbi:MAG TPA: 4Fe-4S binding protein [bacterium]|nr:4Fe-4S binding protein [bacterium]